MTIPGFQDIMYPLLEIAKDGQEHSLDEAIETLSSIFNLSQDDLNELLPSGKQLKFSNRVGWARTYLIKAGLLESTRRKMFRITTSRGMAALQVNPPRIDVKYLLQFPEFIEFHTPRSNNNELSNQRDENIVEDQNFTPIEQIELNYQNFRKSLAQDLLEMIKSASPKFFESLVIDLLLALGYGGSRKDAGQAIGQTGDGGIDGIIKEDILGLDIVYIQAKRWDNNNAVSRPNVQAFAGSLEGKRARKGVFITTSRFTNDAREFVNIIEKKIVLIDGEQLVQFMIDHNVGVTEVASYVVKKIDNDYFNDDYS